MAEIPTCCVTGRIAGDPLACGDCDPCIDGARHVPESVKRLIAERDEWADKYAGAMMDMEEAKGHLEPVPAPECPQHYGMDRCFRCGVPLEHPTEHPQEHLRVQLRRAYSRGVTDAYEAHEFMRATAQKAQREG